MHKKRNSPLKLHSNFIKLAFEQAKINIGSTGSNPSVGCIVTKNKAVISSGYTSFGGRPHAEFNALNKKLNFKNAEMYVSLEPCSHYGKTSPCTNIIKKKKLKKIFFSIYDPDVRSYQKSIKIFKKNKILTNKGIAENFAKFFYQSYFSSKNKNLPLIDAKIALSLDFYSGNKNNKWITNIHSRKRVHLLRSFYDCLISTSKTINDDNSKLNCRINGLSHKSPALVILDRNLKIKKNLNIFKIKKRKIYLFTCKKNLSKFIFLKKMGVKVIKMKTMINKNDYEYIFRKLNKMGYPRIFVESGLTFLNYLKSNNLVNTLYLFQSNNKIGKNGINKKFTEWIKKKIPKNKTKVNLFEDKLFKISV
ncbi:bifunctional diaminohydroxyphosphoribosylaminopyrimidine deaminase/5-amino-6-(5-phosphoribosylamino)uracil reductase RibD [Pelagibacteraceae bacterium]|jgi:diaminohydroxyphosphoribosylaminopyrimidine deaminase / 5-amino-6-(5-phosphoribosylamino)uracil reductase|nr:bifunctional diaminohydroxyphosphoribosylaminopyrimidine deaminase/5-amino-6-(5-phosphoribosylamino)uracil reductase RibD [Pelagibacteraceae bacterium]|tara:strand:- start:2317 stop:3405 length:1089 start_codon:yes stop_codon:yes gene_type:complete